jgi:hypothetical protein
LVKEFDMDHIEEAVDWRKIKQKKLEARWNCDNILLWSVWMDWFVMWSAQVIALFTYYDCEYCGIQLSNFF